MIDQFNSIQFQSVGFQFQLIQSCVQSHSTEKNNQLHSSSTGLLTTNYSELLAMCDTPSHLQILEALNYLHSICKLVHRNLNPRNILIAANDNWKLSGLEFAIRFESATISESASMMANEGANSLLRYSSGAGAQAALRRQRTLVCITFGLPACLPAL